MRARGSWLLGLVLSCTATPPPGDVSMGTFAIHAEPVSLACVIDYGVGPDAGPDFAAAAFDFGVTLTLQSDAGRAYLTTDGCGPSASNCVRDASWDGQVLTSTAVAPREFPTPTSLLDGGKVSCANCVMRMTEIISVSLLSNSQSEAVSFACPASPLSGGTPAANPDAGIRSPALVDGVFDAVLACGELHTTLEAKDLDGGTPDGGEDGGCPLECLGCTTSFSLTGTRK